MKKRDPIEELVRKYGKRESEIDEVIKPRMVKIIMSTNPKEAYYVPSDKLLELEMKQLEYELKEIARG